ARWGEWEESTEYPGRGGQPLRFDPLLQGPKGARIGPSLHFPILAEGLDLALHYGWFAEPSEVADSLETLRAGQVAFTSQVLKLVAPAAERVLDVGTGRGETARALAAIGARVVTLSPDLDQGRWLRRNPHPGIAFWHGRFEDFRPSPQRLFDHVLFSESSNYVALDNLLAHSAALTGPAGALLIAAPFLRGERSLVYRDMHRQSEFRAKISRSVWHIREEHDFTQQVAPTLRIGRHLLEHRVVPSARAIDRYLAEQGPIPVRLLSWLLASYRRRGLSLLGRELPALLDPRAFCRDVAFLFLRLEKTRR
ncbi:MAG TPA: class I SAM-dependent methyltransferase, partial [Polyangiaceae bacterium]|nr:class I SAM-dependent methyltransferase [Polyangiaceae bacterium]